MTELEIGWLRQFLAIAKHCNLTRAARDLGISQPSLSYQLQRLEETIGTPLFVRLHRGVSLTPAGQILAQAVSNSVIQIDQAISEIRKKSRRPAIRILTDYGFATFWLMPRVSYFREQNPDFDVNIIAAQTVEDSLDSTCDIAILSGPEGMYGKSELLFAETVVPVCSTAFANRFGPFNLPEKFQTVPLLHLDAGRNNRWLEWANWMAAHHLTRQPESSDLHFNTYSMVLQSALAGHGIALGWRGLIEDYIESGALMEIGPALDNPGHGYCLYVPGTGAAPIDTFLYWIKQELGKTEIKN